MPGQDRRVARCPADNSFTALLLWLSASTGILSYYKHQWQIQTLYWGGGDEMRLNAKETVESVRGRKLLNN